jgi:predicted nucleic acid-binding protein
MKAVVLADTGPLYALADPSDQLHRRAVADLESIGKRNFAVAVSYPNLCEAHTLVLRRLGGEYACQWLDEIFEGAVLVNPEPGDYQLAGSRLKRFADHPITLVDAVVAALSFRLEVPVWSFDRNFITMRANLWRATNP